MINHYQLLRSDRTGAKRGGGVLLYVRDVFTVHIDEQLTSSGNLDNVCYMSHSGALLIQCQRVRADTGQMAYYSAVYIARRKLATLVKSS